MLDPNLVDVLTYGIPQGKKTSFEENPPVSFHFMVSFFTGYIFLNPLDIRFQTVSGISAEVEVEEIREGGENMLVQTLPTRIVYDNLTLERGMVIGSLLNAKFDAAMSFMKFKPSNVLVILLNEKSLPLAAWTFHHAYPLKWTISDLDANENGVVIETMELHYSRFQSVKI